MGKLADDFPAVAAQLEAIRRQMFGPVDKHLASLAADRARRDGITLPEATKAVAAEHPDLARQWAAEGRAKRGEEHGRRAQATLS